jgi:translation initiation factor 1
MSKQKKQRFEGVVYSTADDFEYQGGEPIETPETLPANKQQLKVMLDKKMRKGKVVTIVTGFVGAESDLEILGKKLKHKCGVGGTSKNGEIMIQGDFKQKIVELLNADGYKVKVVGG